jgi:RNA polymerase-binding protein DksA
MAKTNHAKGEVNLIKSQLEQEKQRIEKELSDFSEESEKVQGDYEAKFDDIGDEVDDNVHEVEQYQVNKSLEITLEKRLRDINNALKRIEKGTYGTCKYCDKLIEVERLKVRPTSSSCVNCKKTLRDEA